MVPPTSQQKKKKKKKGLCSYFKKVETNEVQSHILQTQMHLKSRKSTPNFEDKRGHSTKGNKRWWLTTYLTTYKSNKLRRRPVRTATTKVDQKVISTTMTNSFLI